MNKVIVLMHRYIDGAYEKDNILGVATTEDSAIRMIRSYFNDRYESQYDKIGEIMNNKVESPKMAALRLRLWARDAEKQGIKIHDLINIPKELNY